jgi:NAD kinase/nicotinic acid mononucleotide adenylyltransferase
MSQRIVVFGGSFNPPGRHHRRIVELLAPQFDKMYIVPCGPRPDKSSTQDIDPIFRAALVDLAFRDLPRVEIDNSDLEYGIFTRTHELQSRYESQGEIWHVIGADIAVDGGKGESLIHRIWQEGPRLWQELNFIVVQRPGYALAPEDLPPRHRIMELDDTGSSTAIREDLFRRRDVGERLDPAVCRYIERYGLYRGRIPNRLTRWSLEEPRLLLFADERNTRARGWKEHFRAYEVTEKPNCILVLGGDGTMLRAIRKFGAMRVPFLGLNAGHLGFLLNNAELVLENFPPRELLLRQLPMLYVETFDAAGRYRREYAFNDAWIERATSQSAWLEVSVGGRIRIPKLVCDGALLATPSGSTAYAMSMGAAPLLADTQGWLIVGSNVMNPAGWKSALLAPDSTIELRNLDREKRPLNGFVDGRSLESVDVLRVRLSRTATVELGFVPNHDIAEKIADVQFPPVNF